VNANLNGVVDGTDFTGANSNAMLMPVVIVGGEAKQRPIHARTCPGPASSPSPTAQTLSGANPEGASVNIKNQGWTNAHQPHRC
jgi:uncharacterized protein YjbI with pentapeptide repeats